MTRNCRQRAIVLTALILFVLSNSWSAPAGAQTPAGDDEVLVNLDFDNVEIAEVIDLIAQMTSKNFIYDDRVRGRVTIVSPNKVTIEQAYAVFESVLQVKGFTTVESPGGAVKVIPIREAKESNIETIESNRRPANRDHFVTRLIPLRYVEAEPIVNTLKPLVSKEAAIVAYAPTNTVILTESSSNIRRVISILESIDVETYLESLTVIKVEYADAATLATQISDIYGAEVGGSTSSSSTSTRTRRTAARTPTPAALGGPTASRVRIITDERTNSLIVLAPRTQLEDVRKLVMQLDVPVEGGGRIHVYYLKNANAEELASTLSSLISGQPGGGSAGRQTTGSAAQTQSLRAAVTQLAEGITITADPATNSLVIQASKEGYAALSQVIEQLDRERPQVLVEALIVEVDVTDSLDLGFSGIVRLANGDTEIILSSLTGGAIAGALDETTAAAAGGAIGGPLGSLAGQSGAAFAKDALETDDEGNVTGGYQAVMFMNFNEGNSDLNILSAPHILTTDNEQAEIRVGNNIPIITSRVQSAAGQTVGLSSSVNVERQDIGITLRVTPQITEGDTLRLEIFQELTDVNESLTASFGADAGQNVGVALLSRKIENTVIVGDGETVVIGGLISDAYNESITKVPFLGDIPFLGWLFKSTTMDLRKVNLLVFLTPRVIRSALDLEYATIEKREEFRSNSAENLSLDEEELEDERALEEAAEEAGTAYEPETRGAPVRRALLKHQARYPVERMMAIERSEREAAERALDEADRAESAPTYYLKAAVFGQAEAAADQLTALIDAGFDGTLVTEEIDGIVLFEVRVGPFDTIDQAENASAALRRSEGLAPTVLIDTPSEVE